MPEPQNPYRPPHSDSTVERPFARHDVKFEIDDENPLARRILSVAIFACTGALVAALIVIPAMGGAGLGPTALITMASGSVVGGLIGSRICSE